MSKQARWLLRPPRNAKRLKTPRTGLLTCALFSHLPKHERSARLQWFPEFSAMSETALAEFLPSSNNQNDGLRGRGAHSCGAVAEFHRLPEHPGDICGELHCSSTIVSSHYVIERTSMTSTFITAKLREVKDAFSNYLLDSAWENVG